MKWTMLSSAVVVTLIAGARSFSPTPLGQPAATLISAPYEQLHRLRHREVVAARRPVKAGSTHRVVYRANAATKWAVALAQTVAVASRRDIVAPYIVVGSIAAAFSTAKLKRIIDQQRPEGAPFTDPGMPSSHALVATFAAASWAVQLQTRMSTLGLMLGAAIVSVLRVVTVRRVPLTPTGEPHSSWAQADPPYPHSHTLLDPPFPTTAGVSHVGTGRRRYAARYHDGVWLDVARRSDLGCGDDARSKLRAARRRVRGIFWRLGAIHLAQDEPVGRLGELSLECL